MARLRFAAGIAALAAALWLVVGRGLVNYDTLYALVWGRDLGHGHLPDYDISLAPTPHPLATLIGLVLAPLSSASHGGLHGEAAVTAVIVLAFVALALLGWVVYRLGTEWFNRGAGVLAAAIVLTRQPVLDFGARAYVDMAYLVLVLGALLVETRRRHAGMPVLALLGVAGLLRPEAWLFAGVYWLYLWRTGDRTHDELAGLLALAAAAPALWLLADLAVTGDPLHSLTGTRNNVETLGRVTGLVHVPTTAPRRLGEILREPVLFGAAGGGIMALLWLRSRALLGAVTGVVAIAAFCVLAAAGLPIIGRYLLLPATILALFCAAGALGWLELPRGDPHRIWWARFGALVFVALAAFVPAQVNRIRDLRHALARQDAIQDDLGDLIRSPTPAITRSCRPIAVPNHRPVPVLALWLDTEPQDIVSAAERTPRLGTYVTPASHAVAKDYILDKRDPVKVVPRVPPGFGYVARNASWRVYKRCAPPVHIHGGE